MLCLSERYNLGRRQGVLALRIDLECVLSVQYHAVGGAPNFGLRARRHPQWYDGLEGLRGCGNGSAGTERSARLSQAAGLRAASLVALVWGPAREGGRELCG
jgi:hypothetical protein